MMKSEKKNIWDFLNEILDIYNIDMQNSVKQQIYKTKLHATMRSECDSVKYSIL